MNLQKAINTAIKALEFQATEVYEGSEYDDTTVANYVKEQRDAIEILTNLDIDVINRHEHFHKSTMAQDGELMDILKRLADK